MPQFRNWDDAPPDYALDAAAVGHVPVETELFSIELEHNGFFCGLGKNLTYVSGTRDHFDYCSTATFSTAVIDEILATVGCHGDGKLHVYWCLPGKGISDGLVAVQNDSDTAAICVAGKKVKTISLLIDHSNFLKQLRDDVIFKGDPKLPPSEASSSVVISRAWNEDGEASQIVQSDNSDSEMDSDFYDSDCNAQYGDDDLFADNVDKSLKDYNEREVVHEGEDETALEDEALDLSEDERDQLKLKFKTFDPEIDMEIPVFKVGMSFADVKEVRQALSAYAVKWRKKIWKPKNDKTRVIARCDPEFDCPWMFKATQHSRHNGGFVCIAYHDHHTCDEVWDMRCLASDFLKRKFMDEFRDNQQMTMATFAAKVQREYNMCPDRWKLTRARTAALLEIHGDEEEQYRLLQDYGHELMTTNPGSKFFITTNKVQLSASGEVKEHLATLYWSYDACKRGFLAGCRPVICIDGCHVKTRFKGQLLTAVGIDLNDCIYPVAMALVEVECTSSWESF